MGRHKEQVERKNITKDILLGILKTGALLTLATVAPGTLKIFKNFGEKDPWFEYYPSSIERVTRRLYRKGMVEIKYNQKIPTVQISQNGKIEILSYDLDKLRIKSQTHWDGKWRLVIFDIAEKYKKIREIVRVKLKELGFYQFQDSVFIYPYPCEKEIIYLREILLVPHSIKLVRADRIENDEDLRKIFKLN